jgi:hypothetical protein
MVHLPFAPVIAGKNVYQLCTICPRHSTGIWYIAGTPQKPVNIGALLQCTMYHYTKNMGLKEYCEKKGIKVTLPTDTSVVRPVSEPEKKPYQTVGEIFDWYKARGFEKLPGNVKINSGRWKAQ